MEKYLKYVAEKTKYYKGIINKIANDNSDYNIIENELLGLMDEKDKNITIHCNHVKIYTNKILNMCNNDNQFKLKTLKAAQIHDLGKIVIPDEILFNDDEFTKEEYEIMKLHTTVLYDLLENDKFNDILPIAVSHHERPDGNGYPNGIKNILKSAQIISIADAYDAMTSKRTYNHPLTKNEALKVLINESNVSLKKYNDYQTQHFDFDLVKRFIKSMK